MTTAAKFAGLATLATVFLAMVAGIAFNRAAFSRAGTRCLAEDIIHDVEGFWIHVAMVVLAAHIAAFAAKMELVANLMLSSPAVIRFPDVLGRHRKVAVDAVTILIDGNKFFRLGILRR